MERKKFSIPKSSKWSVSDRKSETTKVWVDPAGSPPSPPGAFCVRDWPRFIRTYLYLKGFLVIADNKSIVKFINIFSQDLGCREEWDNTDCAV